MPAPQHLAEHVRRDYASGRVERTRVYRTDTGFTVETVEEWYDRNGERDYEFASTSYASLEDMPVFAAGLVGDQAKAAA